MSKAYLRIDDTPSEITEEFMDYLCDKGIKPVVFAVGENIEKRFDEAVYALKKGAVIGNHSYSHKNFNEISFEECVEEIEKCEKALEKLYNEAGVERKYKFFAFPYGDKGGENKDKIQKYLKEKGFCRLDDREIGFEWYKEADLHKDIDTFWTFDFGEYMLPWESGYTYASILERIHDRNPDSGGALLEEGSMHIVMIHDHGETNRFMPGYYKTILDYVMDCGVEFVEPKFVDIK